MFFACVRDLLDEHVAAEVKTIGDAVMLRAERASDGIALGLAIVEAVDAQDWFPTVRVGMSTGEAIEQEGDWFGSTVNLAARIAGVAGGGAVLLSEATRKTAGTVEGVEFQRYGEVQLRNVAQPVLLFRAVHGGKEREELPVDPVCRMTVAPNASVGNLVYASPASSAARSSSAPCSRQDQRIETSAPWPGGRPPALSAAARCRGCVGSRGPAPPG